MSVAARIAKLEALSVAQAPTHDLKADAAEFCRRIERYAESYPDEAAYTPLSERLKHFSPAMHFAWGLRFQPETTTLADIMEMHGLPLPAFTGSEKKV